MPGRTASRRRRGLRVAVALLATALGIAAIAGSWPQVRAAAGELTPGAIGVAAIAVLIGLFASMLAWRAVLADLGSPLSLRAAMRVFYLGQLGKYLPGSVWWLLGQAELAADVAVPRRRTAAAGVVTVAISLICGLLLAALLWPILAAGDTVRYRPALAAVPLLLFALHPRFVTAALNRVLRLARRDRLEYPLTGRGIATALGYSAGAWLAYGAQVAVLAADLGATGPRAAALSVGGFALAWSIGFLAVLVPAGIGVREAALVGALAPVLPTGPALVIAVLSRVLMSGADLAWAALAAGIPRRTADAELQPAGSDRVEPV